MSIGPDDHLPKIDLLAQAFDRLIAQYRESPNFRAMIQLFIEQVEEWRDEVVAFYTTMNLDDATGWQLDVIGEIVGIPRPLVPETFYDRFAYLGYAGALGYGDLHDGTVGGVYGFIWDGTSGVPVNDAQYRGIIRAKIVLNHGSVTPEEIIEIARAAYAGFPEIPKIFVTEGPTAEGVITFGRLLSVEEKAILETGIVTGPRGVSITFAESYGPASFTYQDPDIPDVIGLGYGDAMDPGVGGPYGSLI